MMRAYISLIVFLLLSVPGVSRSGGEEWYPLARPTTNDLRSISCVSSSLGWVGGNHGTILRTTNGGASWTTQESGIGADIHHIFFLDSLRGWALAFELPGTGSTAGGTLYLFTTNGGAAWERTMFSDEYFNAVTFVSPSNGWMGGEGGRFIGTTNGGSSWFDAVVDSEHVFGMPVHSIRFRGTQEGYAVGGYRELVGVIWATTNGGSRWKQITLGDDLHEVAFLDSLTILCAGGGLDDGSGMAKSLDGGHSFSFTYLGFFGVSKAMAFRTPHEGWASVGSFGSYIHTRDGGNTWTVATTPETTGVADIAFPDSTTGYMVGAGGMVLKHHTSIAELELASGWNLLSLPLRPFERLADSLIPSAASRWFGYADGYHPDDSVSMGNGYWLKAGSDMTVTIRGLAVDHDTIPIRQRWNLVGGISSPVPVAGVQTIPPGIIASQFFDFQGSYTPADTLRPGRGYWVKSGGDGVMILKKVATSLLKDR